MESIYVAEYAKSGRSKCKKCFTLIDEEVLRLGVMKQARRYDGKHESWYHSTCFFQINNPKSINNIKKFENLRIADQELIKENINKKLKRNHSEISSNTVELDDSLTKKNKTDIDLEVKYNIQNKKIYNFRDNLKANGYKRKDLRSFLVKNGQNIPRGVPAMLDTIAEILTCGALKKCRVCGYGRFAYDKNGYECQSYGEWRSCKNKETAPTRMNWEIPENVSEGFCAFLSSIESCLEDRIFISSFNNSSIEPEVNNADFERDTYNLKMKLKSGSHVDPKSNLARKAHIYEEKGYKYNIALILVDIERKKNSFYKIQLLKEDNKPIYWIFRSWGRTGTDFGDTAKEQFNTSFEAIMEFEKLYLKFTGNEWTDPEIFKKPRKYLPVEIDYGTEEIIKKVIEPSKLDVIVQEFLGLITNIDFMENILVEYEIDIKRMPLGKITSNQLELAVRSLFDILQLISKGGSDAQFIEASNQFYSAVPHNVGIKDLPILRTKEQVLRKGIMLKELNDIKINYDIINFEQLDKRNPIDVFYDKLNTEIIPITSDSNEYQMIKQYVENTHGSSHNFKLEIANVFEINRKEEDLRYEPFKNDENRKLLWHGSRLTNFGGIFTNGLLIAPPGSYFSGAMFGNGIYFADCVSKSAHYCAASSNGIGALLLCEVALGEMKEFDHSQHPSCITDLIEENKSCKGLGKYIPNPEERVIQNGVEIPLGKIIRADNIHGELIYNEYIQYNVNKIKVKYLVLLNFYNK